MSVMDESQNVERCKEEKTEHCNSKTKGRKYYVYWLQSKSKCYYGATVDPVRRLKQHNELLAGGSQKTRGRGPWHFHCVIEGFHNWNDALKFEWAIKYYSKNCRSIETRQKSLDMLLQKERWTSNSPLASEVDLTIYKQPLQFGLPPENYHSLQEQKNITKSTMVVRQKSEKKTSEKKTNQNKKNENKRSENQKKHKTRKFKKTLYGVNY